MDPQQHHISPLVDIYNHMVAGCFPLAEGLDPSLSVRMQAQEVLNAQDVHFLLAVENGAVFYLACNSRALASTPNFTTALAAALPGHRDHQGDGAYYLPLLPSNAVAVIRRGNSLKLFVNSIETVQESVESEGLSRFELTDSSAEPLQSQSWVYRKMANRVATTTSMAALGVIALSAVVVLASNAVSGFVSHKNSRDVAGAAERANSLIETTSTVQPLTEQMNRVQSLSYAAVSAGGWIDGYNYRDGAGERYVVSLPSWVTQDAIKPFGDGVITEAQPGGQFIWVLKKDSNGLEVKNRGPAPISNAPPPPSTGASPSAAAHKPAA